MADRSAYSEVEQKEPGADTQKRRMSRSFPIAFNPRSTPEGAWATYGEVGAPGFSGKPYPL